ncbi:MAG: antitoxin VbhA family protein [Candidatus Caenarcaniphilales bacterium]|nr:antitoxin VbhA family protein [Candidatus Caenarcaniphilales bacterium]
MQNPKTKEIEFSKIAAKAAVAQQRLEGLKTSRAFLKDLSLVLKGDLDIPQALSNITKRYS